MELIEKKEGESVDQSSFNNPITDKEADERQARDLKAGLHPLKVSLSLSLSFSSLPELLFVDYWFYLTFPQQIDMFKSSFVFFLVNKHVSLELKFVELGFI